MREYTEINQVEFLLALQKLPASKIVLTDLRPDTQEMVYDLYLSDNDSHVVRVYSSIDYSTGVTRDSGEDAIRILVTNPETHFVLTRCPKVLRINTWQDNLTKRLKEALTYLDGFYKLHPKHRDINSRNAIIRSKMLEMENQ